MRASRLLHMLLLLQNHGRMTSAALARELEVAQRTILRDVDALTEAGLPVVVVQGNRGGIELGFDYRTRLTGLAADEAEALGAMLARPCPELRALGLGDAATRARRKLVESFPDTVRSRVTDGGRRFRIDTPERPDEDDPRLEALACAVREQRVVRIRAYDADERVVHPIGLVYQSRGWAIDDELTPGAPVPLEECGHVNISSRRFVPTAVVESRRA